MAPEAVGCGKSLFDRSSRPLTRRLISGVRCQESHVEIFSILLLLVTPILFLAALAVRFAGDRRVLSSIDYSTISNPAALNRWAGNRLMFLPLLSLSFGVLSLNRQPLSIIGCGAVALAGLLTIVWIGAGSDRFRVGTQPFLKRLPVNPGE